MITGDQIRMARAAIRLGVRELAEKAGVAPMTISRLENGHSGGQGDTLRKIETALSEAGVEFIDDTGVKMRPLYLVVSVRISRGVDVQEGRYYSEADAIAHMDRLGDDPDCLLAEVQRWPVASAGDSAPERILIVAQAERIGGRWQRVEGDIRSRTIGGEAQEMLRRASSVT